MLLRGKDLLEVNLPSFFSILPLNRLDIFLDLTNITTLWIYTNSSSIFPWQFTYLTSLTDLAFRGAQKISSLTQNFSKTLLILDLSSNSFTEIPSIVVQSKNIELLSMISNYISDSKIARPKSIFATNPKYYGFVLTFFKEKY